MRGLDPRIHDEFPTEQPYGKKSWHGLMDGRVKPGHDGGGDAARNSCWTKSLRSVTIRPQSGGTTLADIKVMSAGAVKTMVTALGAEFHLGERFSLLVAGIIGFDATRTPADNTFYSVAWGARLGLGYRIF